MKMMKGMVTGLCGAVWTIVVLGFLAAPGAAALAQEGDGAEGDAPEMSEEEMQKQYDNMIESFGWERTGRGNLGNIAEVAIPDGFRFTGRDGTQKLMRLFGNTLTKMEQGTLAPEGMDWFVVFEFDEIGYVKDDEKDEIDADELLGVFIQGQVADNERRRAAGMGTLTVVGWAKEPFYNEATNNLEWALELRDEQGNISVNYKTKLLGRRGVMGSILVCGADALQSILPTYQTLIADFHFSQGNAYAEYQKGDKLSSLGLKALVVGGGVFVAAKTGLFAVLFKFIGKIWILLVAAAVGLKSYIARLFSRGKNEYTTDE